MPASRIVDKLVNNGNSLLGCGHYAAAVSIKTDKSKIIKIGSTTIDPWLAYYYDVILPNSNNLFVPKIQSVYIDADADYYICVMERLLEGPCIFSAIASDCSQYLNDEYDEYMLVEALSDKKCPNIDSLLYLLEKLKEGNKNCMFELDLHTCNIMYRGTQPVITDPWCSYDINDEPDFEYQLIEKGYEL